MYSICIYSDDNLNSKNGIFYFTHSGTILKMLGLLGLYKDEDELRHDNYLKMQNRQWKTSQIDAFGSNLAFILYKYYIYIFDGYYCYFTIYAFRCNNDVAKILTLHQERIVRLKGCEDNLCLYDTFKQLYETQLKNCDFNQMCNID